MPLSQNRRRLEIHVISILKFVNDLYKAGDSIKKGDDESKEAADEDAEESSEDESDDDVGASEEIQNAVKGIDNAFNEVDMYALPHPGETVAHSSESSQLHVTGETSKCLMGPLVYKMLVIVGMAEAWVLLLGGQKSTF